jgi:hypothetical protein
MSMTEKEHSKIMTNIMKELDKDKLDLADGISIWHSLGLFLFSNLDKENKDVSKIYKEMKNYLVEIEKMKKTKNKIKG